MKKLIVAIVTLMFILNASGQKSYNIKDLGAAGNGHDLDTKAIQEAIDRCYADSGGVVFFPPGVYVSGSLYLKSNVTLNIGEGAVLQGSSNLNDYQLEPDTSYVYSTSSRYVFIHCVNMHNVSITGKGVIDGIRLEDPGAGNKHGRGPLGVFIEGSTKILISGVTIKDAAGWSLTLYGCKGVTVRDVKVLNGRFDGINPVSSSDVLIDACTIEGTGDDPITIKNEGNPANGHVTENIIIRNCFVRNTTHPAIKIGTGTAGIFRNIQVSGCVFENTGEVFSIQLMRASLEINPVRTIENLTFTDIIARNVLCLFDITTIAVDKPVIHDIHFNNIIVNEAKRESQIIGTPEAPISDISVENIYFRSKNGNMDAWLKTDYVNNLSIRNIDLHLNENIRSVLDFRNGEKLSVTDINLPCLQNKQPLFLITQAKDIKIKAADTYYQFPQVSVTGNLSENISVISDFPLTKQPVIVTNDVNSENIFPRAGNVEIDEVEQKAGIKAGDPGTLIVSLRNNGAAGMYKLKTSENNQNTGSSWLWLSEKENKKFSFELKPIYLPGKHNIEVNGKNKPIEVQTSPPRIIINDTMQIKNDPSDKMIFTLKLQNTGGEKGSKTVKLMQNGKVAYEKTLELQPGEIKKVDLYSLKTADKTVDISVEEFPEWYYNIVFTRQSEFYLTKSGHIIIDAGGRSGVLEDYGAVYMNNVKGDFDVITKFGSTQPTGTYAGIGIIVRNELTDFTSNGLVEFHHVLKYGGMNVWRNDADGDGKFDESSSTGGKDWYKLSKRGKKYGLAASNDGKNWHQLGLKHENIIESAEKVQDAGIFGNSYNENAINRVVFEYFKVVPVNK
ncbi:MAG: right-handed parallel beta-helix repeat-containing protein [Bacteroidetes bacterium]|nr:right-handed parallel beta-helix repeat-containing protein [Bacteroidota bacterium]